MKSNQFYIPSYFAYISITLLALVLLTVVVHAVNLVRTRAVPAMGPTANFNSEHHSTIQQRFQKVFGGTTDLWKHLLSLEIPRLQPEHNNRGEFGVFNLMAYIFADFDISDPKAFLQSQIPFLASVEYAQSPVILPDPVVAESPPPDSIATEPVSEAGLEGVDVAAYYGQKPAVMIYHTHNTEAYVPNCGARYVENNSNVTVVRVGEYLTDLLERKYGIPVYHSKDNHVWEPFWASYTHSLVTVQSVISQQPQIRYVFDLHNDGVRYKDTTTTINGQKVARLYFVVGADTKRNPKWRQNHAFALMIQSKIEKRYPGLSRGILLQENARYNQHVRDDSLLIEMGGFENSLEEVFRACDLFAEIIAEVIMEDAQLS